MFPEVGTSLHFVVGVILVVGENLHRLGQGDPSWLQPHLGFTLRQQPLRFPGDFTGEIVAGKEPVPVILIDGGKMASGLHHKTRFLRQLPDAALL